MKTLKSWVALPFLGLFLFGCSGNNDTKVQALGPIPAPIPAPGALGRARGPNHCPWKLPDSVEVARFKKIGVDVQFDCSPVMTNEDGRVQRATFTNAIQSLGETLDVVAAFKDGPLTIVIGPRGDHDGQQRVIKFKANVDLRRTPRLIAATLQLMTLERREFGSRVKFSIGDPSDEDHAAEDLPDQVRLERELNTVRKFKPEILAHSDSFPFVSLLDEVPFEEGDLSNGGKTLIYVNEDQGFYRLSSEVGEEKIRGLFNYLNQIAALKQAYAPVGVFVPLYRPGIEALPDYVQTTATVRLAQDLRDLIQTRPIKMFSIQSTVYSVAESAYGVQAAFDGERFVLRNVRLNYTTFVDLRALRACVERLDFSAPFIVRCPRQD